MFLLFIFVSCSAIMFLLQFFSIWSRLLNVPIPIPCTDSDKFLFDSGFFIMLYFLPEDFHYYLYFTPLRKYFLNRPPLTSSFNWSEPVHLYHYAISILVHRWNFLLLICSSSFFSTVNLNCFCISLHFIHACFSHL